MKESIQKVEDMVKEQSFFLMEQNLKEILKMGFRTSLERLFIQMGQNLKQILIRISMS